MREILFKAKRIDNGEWVEGDLIHSFDGENRFAISNAAGLYEIVPYTICQYTGLTDKNGVKIWENDVVKYEDAEADFEGYHDNVFVNVGKTCITPQGVFFTNRQTVDMDDLWLSECSVDAEVIGNIFDNPELLEGR